MANKETYFALSTPSGRSATATIRISGPNSKNTILKLLKNKNKKLNPGLNHVVSLYNKNNDLIDKCIVVFYKGPKSFTGEDLCEFQIHGGLGVIKILMDTCIFQSLPGKIVRFAEPGEFSKRAYINGKICLHEAEAISDLVNAESEEKVNAINRMINEGFGKDIISLAFYFSRPSPTP